mmetsp:Transcript_105464/g.264055  ORF Transcript_105464/g.264055 Transcript_105464/m.264055 type:complete len:209 (+) Transcript_105464:399-1025(+)
MLDPSDARLRDLGEVRVAVAHILHEAPGGLRAAEPPHRGPGFQLLGDARFATWAQVDVVLLAVPTQERVHEAAAALLALVGFSSRVRIFRPAHPVVALGAPHAVLDLDLVLPRLALRADVSSVQLAVPPTAGPVHGLTSVAIIIPLPVVRAVGEDHVTAGYWMAHLLRLRAQDLPAPPAGQSTGRPSGQRGLNSACIIRRGILGGRDH